MFAAMVDFPVFLLFLLFWLVIVPVALYLIIRTAVEHGIPRVHGASPIHASSPLLLSDSRRTPPTVGRCRSRRKWLWDVGP